MEHIFESREAASESAAGFIADALERRLLSQPRASLVVSGGTSPIQCFRFLADSEVEWRRVDILLSDERWVARSDDDSNENLVRSVLLRNNAIDARLLSYYDAREDIDTRCATIENVIREVPQPFACTLLGMGEDGHFASLFVDIDPLSRGLEPECDRLCIPVTTALNSHRRISLTLAALLNSDVILLLFFGERKRDVYRHAKASSGDYPVARLLTQHRVPIYLLWAP